MKEDEKGGICWKRSAIEEEDRRMRSRKTSKMKLSSKPFDIVSLSFLKPSSILSRIPPPEERYPHDTVIAKLQ
jgi:hypothetical protein